MTIPNPVRAEARTSVEIVDSCNCCIPCCRKKAKHRKKPEGQAEAKVKAIAIGALGNSTDVSRL